MRLSPSDHERLDRLASEVKKGGGLALPLFFSAILHELLDNGPTTNDRIVDIVRDIGANKTKRLAETWHGSWQELTDDLMNQLAHKGYAEHNGDQRWHLGGNFQEGVRLETIPVRKGLNAADHTTVFNREERERRDQESYIEHEKEQTIRQPRSRHHSPDTMKLFRETYETWGPINRVIIDAKARVIDGRHRREIDPNWPALELRRRDGGPITTDEEFLAAVLMLDDLNREEKLTAGEREKINRILGELPGVNATKRARVEAALREDATRSNRAIAELLGVSDMFVGKVRDELQTVGSIHRYEFGGGKGIRAGQHSSDCWCGEGEAPLAPAKAPKQPRQGPGQHPAFTEQQYHEFARQRDEGTSWLDAEANVRGFDKPRASLTTEGQKARARYEQEHTPAPVVPVVPAAVSTTPVMSEHDQLALLQSIWADPQRHAEELLEDEVLALSVYHLLDAYFSTLE